VAGSGLSLKAGQPFAVHATGQVSFIPNGPLVGPNGASDLHPGVCVLPGVADRGGELFLGINDTGVDNNSGSFHVVTAHLVLQP